MTLHFDERRSSVLAHWLYMHISAQVGPFRLLGGAPPSPLPPPLLDRGPHDPPEFSPLLSVNGGGVAGYWRDEPDDNTSLVVLSKPLAQVWDKWALRMRGSVDITHRAA